MDPSFRLQPNMTSPADADADFPFQAATGAWAQAPAGACSACSAVTSGAPLAGVQRARVCTAAGAQQEPTPARALPLLPAAAAGLGDLAHAWQMQEWHNVTEVTSWAPPHVERVRGSDGVQFRWVAGVRFLQCSA